MEPRSYVREQFDKHEETIKELMAFKIKQAIIKADDHQFPYQCLTVWLENEFDIKYQEGCMKGSELITKIQDSEIGSSSYLEDIKEDDKIQLIHNRIYCNGKYIGNYHYI